MPFPEDRVLVGVIGRKRDLDCLLAERWYRIPQTQMPQGIAAEIIAFYISGSAARSSGQAGIHYHAVLRGFELQRRRDLLPDEPEHPRAAQLYYKLQLGEIVPQIPPVTNPRRRRFSFIRTTWDRLSAARTIADLYSREAGFSDRRPL